MIQKQTCLFLTKTMTIFYPLKNLEYLFFFRKKELVFHMQFFNPFRISLVLLNISAFFFILIYFFHFFYFIPGTLDFQCLVIGGFLDYSQETVDLVTFTEENLNEKPRFFVQYSNKAYVIIWILNCCIFQEVTVTSEAATGVVVQKSSF